MKNLPSRATLRTTSVTVGVAALLFALTVSASSFAEPQVAPPGDDAYAPINVGTYSQYKSGYLGIDMTGNPSHPLEVWGNGTDGTAAIFPSGSVGVGTANPATKSLTIGGTDGGYQICLNGTGPDDCTNTSPSKWGTGGGSSYWTLASNGKDISNTNSGTVGIQHGLDVEAATNNTGDGLFINSRTRDDSDNAIHVAADTASGDFVVRTNGKVGIGTTDPDADLTVTDSGDTAATLILRNNNGEVLFDTGYPTGGGNYATFVEFGNKNWTGNLNGGVNFTGLNSSDAAQMTFKTNVLTTDHEIDTPTLNASGDINTPTMWLSDASGESSQQYYLQDWQGTFYINPGIEGSSYGNGISINSSGKLTAGEGLYAGTGSDGTGIQGIGTTGYGVYGDATGSGGVGVRGESTTAWGGYFTGKYGLHASGANGDYGEIGAYGYSFIGNGPVRAPEFCLGTDCISSWPSTQTSGYTGQITTGEFCNNNDNLTLSYINVSNGLITGSGYTNGGSCGPGPSPGP